MIESNELLNCSELKFTRPTKESETRYTYSNNFNVILPNDIVDKILESPRSEGYAKVIYQDSNDERKYQCSAKYVHFAEQPSYCNFGTKAATLIRDRTFSMFCWKVPNEWKSLLNMLIRNWGYCLECHSQTTRPSLICRTDRNSDIIGWNWSSSLILV